MKSFLTFLSESNTKYSESHVLLFGRMASPTKGHEENINFAKNLAAKNNASLSVVASHTHGDKKNPLTPRQKLRHLKRAFPDAPIKIAGKRQATIFDHAKEAYKKGVKHLTVVAGGDRASAFEKMLNSYNGKEYNFHSIKVVSSGERKEGVSGSDMRKHASRGDYDSFKSGLPSNLKNNERHAKSLYNDIRKGMGIK